jgi:hypothetical protein
MCLKFRFSCSRLTPEKVYQIVRKIIDDQPETGRIRLSVPTIYESIRKSNSSLNRKPKRLIEDSLERVLEVVKADMGEDDEDSMAGDFEGLEEPAAAVCYDLCRLRLRMARALSNWAWHIRSPMV